MLRLEMGGTLDGHGAADMDIGCLDLALAKAERGEKLKARVGKLVRRNAETCNDLLAQSPFVEDKLNVEGSRQRLLDLLNCLGREALLLEGHRIDGGGLFEAGMTDRIDNDVLDLAGGVAQHPQRFWHGAIDNLEIAAAGELFELDQREIRLNAGGVAIHYEADGAGRRDHRDLRIAKAVLLAKRQRTIPGASGMLDQVLIRRALVIERDRRRGNSLIPGTLAMRCATMIANDPQHVLAVLLVRGKGAKLGRHFRRSRVAYAGKYRRERARDLAARVGIVRNAGGHQ